MKKLILATLLMGWMLSSSAQMCADCSIGIPTLPEPESVGIPTIFEFSSTGIENDCFGETTNPRWSISGSATIQGNGIGETVTVLATGPYQLTLTTDYSGGTQTCTLETASFVRENPDFEIECGLDVIMVLDESNSISAQEEASVREAVRSFVDGLQGTGSNIAFVEFGTYAEAEVLPGCNLSAGGSPNYTEITQGSINGCINDYLTTDYGITTSGGTNWDDAFYKVQDVIANNAIQPDIVVFFTDGNPTYYIDENAMNALGGSGSTTYTGSVNHAIVQANVVKELTHLLVVGVGDAINEENIKLISGVDANTGSLITDDYVIAPDFESLSNDFFDIALAACGTDVNLTKTGPGCIEPDALEIEYVVSFENEGDQPARIVEITDVIPDGYVVLSQVRNPIIGSVGNVGNVYTWDYGLLDVGESATWTFTVQVPANSGVNTNMAYIEAINIFPEADDTARVVTAVNNLGVSGVVTENLCGAVNIGGVDISVTGGTAPYSFDWSNGATTEDISGVDAGIYTVDITDVNGCATSAEFTIDESTDVSITLNPSQLACGNIICSGADDGSIDATINGGTPPYIYTWSNGADTEDIEDLGPGTYTLDVIDVNGCEASASVTLTEVAALIVSETHQDVTCNDDNGPGSDGSIDVSVSGGCPPYTYSWNTGQTSQDISGLAAGTYIVTITDANGCSEQLSVTIDLPGEFTCSVQLVSGVSFWGLSDGVATVTANGGAGSLSYLWDNGDTRPTADTLSAGSHSVTITDANGCVSTCSVIIPNPTNEPPVANPDIVTTDEDSPVVIDVIGNDTDDFGLDTSTITIEDQPDYGDVTVNGDGTITYDPDPDFAGVDSFIYQICDIGVPVYCDTALVVVTVQPLPDTVVVTIPEDSTVTVCTDTTTNFAGPITDVGICGEPDNGTIEITNSVCVEYVPDEHFVGTDTVCVVTCSGTVCDTTIIVIVVTPVNVPPIAINDVNNTLLDMPVDGQVLTNDFDPDDDNITVTEVNGIAVIPGGTTVPTANGSVTINPDGTYTYTPSPGFVGTDQFTYEICDDGVPGPLCAEATVTIEVIDGSDPFNNPPVANNDATQTEEGNPVVINVIANDYDPDGDVLSTPVQTSNPSNGTVTQNPDGSFTYTPDPGFTGEDQFTYEICDPSGLCDDAVVTIMVTPDNGEDNDPPVAIDDVVYTPFATAVSGDVSLNDHDPDGDAPLTFTQLTDPENGTVIFNPDGTFTYTPDADYQGPDQFIYEVCDGISGCDQATVYIVVGPENQPPVAEDDEAVTEEDVPVVISVVDNDYDPEGGLDTTSIAILDSTNNGTLTINGDGTITYDPDPDFYGTDTFTYQICDVGDPVLCDDAVVIITIDAADDLSCIAAQESAVDCNGNSTGSASVEVFDGSGSYSYLWDNGETTATAVALDAGDHTVTITDGLLGFSTSCSVTIGEPDALMLSEQHEDVTCNDDSGTSDDGTVDLSVEGGTQPYTYSWNNGDDTEDVSGLAAGDYTVIVTDGNGCTASITVTITQPDQLSLTETHVNVACNDDAGASNDGSIDLSVSGGTAPYTYSWSNGDAIEDIANLAAGTYTVIVTDANDCQASISVTITAPNQLTLSETHTDVNCNDDEGTSDDGSVDLTVEGGTIPYSYSWSDGETTEDISGLAAGDYTITVTDANNCSSSITVTISQPEQLSLTETHIDVTCNDDNGSSEDGSIDLSVAGGTAPYSYDWNNGETTEDISGLAAGSYTIVVTDSKGCSASIAVQITEPQLLALTESHIDANCDDEGNPGFGSVDLSVEGGNAPYTFNWSNGEDTEDIADLAPGDYSVTVTDASGCVASISVNIEDNTTPPIVIASGGHLSCTINSTQINSDGPLQSTYEWVGPNGFTSSEEDPIVSQPGIYTVTVTDIKGCAASQTVEVTSDEDLPEVVVSGGGELNCEVSSVELSGSSSTPNVMYQWDINGELFMGQTIQVDEPGTYTLIVTNMSNGCSASAQVTVTENNNVPSASAAGGVITCEAQSISLTGNSDAVDPSYEWTGPNGFTSSDQNPEVDQMGTYFLTVTDNSNGCVATASAIVTRDENAPDVSATGGMITCSVSQVQLTASSDEDDVTFEWTGPDGFTSPEQNPVVDAPGDYTVTATSGENGCSSSASASVNLNIEEPEASATGGTLTCDVNSVQIIGTTSAIDAVWQWSGPGGFSSMEQSPVVNMPGSYSATVTDPANECVAMVTVEIEQDTDDIAIELSSTDVSCAGADNGSATVTITSGNGPFEIEWSNGAGDEVITGLTAGEYTVMVSAANGCTASGSVTVSEADGIELSETHINILCDDGQGAGGSIDLTVAGGTAPYEYDWSNGAATEDLEDLDPGTYTVIVTDAQECTAELSVTIENAEAFTIAVSAISEYDCGNVSCVNELDGSIDITVEGGTGPFTFEWSNGSSDEDLDNIPAGEYTVLVTDANGCQASASASLAGPEPIELIVDTLSAYPSGGNVSCVGATDGFIDVTVSGGCPPYQFIWSNGETTEDLINLGEGIYVVDVIDAAGCQFSAQFELDEADPIDIFIQVTTPQTGLCESESTTLTAPEGFTDYQWYQDGIAIPGANDQTLEVNEQGEYSVEVENLSICAQGASDPIFIEVFPIIKVNMSVNGDTTLCGGGEVEISTGMGFMDYIWYLDGEVIEGESGPVLIAVEEGTYTVMAMDSNGCPSLTDDSLVVVFGNIETPSIAQSGTLVCEDDGFVQVVTDPGYADYDWYFNGELLEDEDDYILEAYEGGLYTVEVTDENGCTATSATINVFFWFANVQTDTVYTEVVEMTGTVFCLDDVLDLEGDIIRVRICDEPEFVEYEYEIVDGNTLCFEFDRLSEDANTDTMCVIVYDNSTCDLSDTTIIIIELPDTDEPPTATEECVEVDANSEVSVDVLANDTDPDGDDLYVSGIVTQPENGTVIIEGGGSSLLYIPNEDYCGEDTFYYEVCDIDNAGCDTAFVCVTVLCECFIPNVLTPNNDGMNDEFYVECLEQIEGAVLRVYNRWGNEVYRSDNYRNDWNGTYDGKPLPEGTYYFIINFTDHQGQVFDLAGDLTILR